MPYKNVHSARVKNPDQFTSFATRKLGDGITAILGIKDGKTTISAYRFSRNRFSAKDARAWLKQHDQKVIEFEPATNADGIELLHRYDRASIKHTVMTPEGFLKTDAIVTRSGVFEYRNADGSVRWELRHPDHVFKEDSLLSMQMIPVTMLHPAEGQVNSDNAKELKVGFTGEHVRVDGSFVKAPIVITDKDAIEKIQAGLQELSLGYSVELIAETGEYHGDRYDFVQTNVSYNHLAVVPKARAGSDARIVLDADDAVMVEKEVKQKNQQKTGGKKMIKVHIDGLEYECAPEVAKALEKAQSRNDELTGQVTTLTEEKSTLEGDRDTLKEKLDKAEKANSDEAVQTAVSARLALVSEASPHLDEETVKKLPEMSDKEIKEAVILAKFPEAKLDEKDDVYIQARYDAALEMKAEKEEHSDEAMADQRSKANGGEASKGGERLDADKSKKAYVENLENAWKPEEK